MVQITRPGATPSGKGPPEWFTGAVRIDPLFGPDPDRVGGALVTFEPGARTAWHTPPARPDPGRHLWPRLGPARWRPDRRNPPRRRRLDSAR